MNYVKYLALVAIFMLFTSCENSTDPNTMNCDNMVKGIIHSNLNSVKSELDVLLEDLAPKVSTDDNFGHKENITTLINLINNQCENLEVELLCYACIKTNPPQSELQFSTDSLGFQINRVVDFLTSSEDIMKIRAIH